MNGFIDGIITVGVTFGYILIIALVAYFAINFGGRFIKFMMDTVRWNINKRR